MSDELRKARCEPDFDAVARPYRWMEYLTFGRLLERCRFALLPRLGQPRSALLLGDGDGRFLASLLRRHPELIAHVVDLSPAMLTLAKSRIAADGNADRVVFHHADLRGELPFALASAPPFDLVTAHFLLDCLTTNETFLLIERLIPLLAPDAFFLISEFAAPVKQPFRLLGQILIDFLYGAFGVLTALPVRGLPAYPAALNEAGLLITEQRTLLGGILHSELWQRSQMPRPPQATPSSIEHSQEVCPSHPNPR